MPRVVEQIQRAELWHRNTFLATATAAGTGWTYARHPTEIKRPADGRAPFVKEITCPTCGDRLRFRVHSVASTRRRQRLFRALAWTSLGLIVAGVGGVVAMWTTDSFNGVLLFLGLTAIVVGLGAGPSLGSMAADDMGITGHGASNPGAVKHPLQVTEPERPGD
ncbi:hypothetical protein OG462_25360 [Streptomyces sp. NBC_01077]|uniref:hypothetical protein n=1 Tax=Streptomyces sp. NBC_01077 TaxID=2903746 RepID=UPI0038682870|nr:hypothetical protein OG462_25360 [Streptomyces sp. NBC_01077]